MRTLVVGDIHGGLRALEQVLAKVGPNSEDTLVFLGDYVDGWSDAANTVTYLIDFSKRYECIFLRGNHDQLTLEWLLTGNDDALWLRHGGAATKFAYENLPAKTIEQHVQFYEALKPYYIDDDNKLYLHAGFTNVNGVTKEYFDHVFSWDRTLWETALALDPGMPSHDKLYPERLKHYQEIFIGHTPVTRIGKTVPVQAANVWNVDTGAAFKGPLSVLESNSKSLWQSDPVYRLYPLEQGRN